VVTFSIPFSRLLRHVGAILFLSRRRTGANRNPDREARGVLSLGEHLRLWREGVARHFLHPETVMNTTNCPFYCINVVITFKQSSLTSCATIINIKYEKIWEIPTNF